MNIYFEQRLFLKLTTVLVQARLAARSNGIAKVKTHSSGAGARSRTTLPSTCGLGPFVPDVSP